MIIFNSELLAWLKIFKAKFDESIPLGQISSGISNERLIAAIAYSVNSGENKLPEVLGYTVCAK